MVGWVCASGRGVAAHMFGLGRVWPCSNIVTSSRLVFLLYHLLRVCSLMVKRARLVPSIKSWLLLTLALILLYAWWIKAQREACSTPAPPLRPVVMVLHKCVQMASTTRLLAGDEAGRRPDIMVLQHKIQHSKMKMVIMHDLPPDCGPVNMTGPILP